MGMDKTFTFKKTYSNNESIKLNLISEVNQHIGALSIGGEDFQVEIKPYSKRSMNALAAYMALIDSIVKWHPEYCKEHGGCPIPKDGWRFYFEKKAGLSDITDMMPFWELEGYKIVDRYVDGSNIYLLKDLEGEVDEHIRFQEKTRSLSNKGDITKEEMTRLLHEVLEFGAQNQVPNCFIPDDELDRLLKFSKGFRDD